MSASRLVLEPMVVRRELRKNTHMKSERNILGLAVAALIVGLLLVFVFQGSGTVDVAIARNGDAPLPQVLFFTSRRVFGVVLVWFSTLVIAAALGFHLRQSRGRATNVR